MGSLTPLAAPAAVWLALPVLAVAAGVVVYWDAHHRGRDRGVAALFGFVVAGLFLAGSVPGLVALAVTTDSAAQGFPTALRVVPGVVAALVYAAVR